MDDDDPGVVAAVERDLDDIRRRDPALARSTLAATALALAADMDRPKTSATAKSMCAKALMETMERLRELAPPEREVDKVDDLAAKRDERRRRVAAGDADPADMPRP